MSIQNIAELKNQRERIGQNWDLAFSTFMNAAKAKGLAAGTIRYYSQALGDFFVEKFAKKIRIASPQFCYTEHIQEYVVYMQTLCVCPTTQNIRLRAVRAFFKYLFKMGYIQHSVEITMVKEGKKVIQTLSDEEVRKLTAPIDQKNLTFAEHRDYVIIAFLIETGVRLSSLLCVRVQHVDFVQKEITIVHAKGGEQYRLPLSRFLENTLSNFINEWGHDDDDFIFCTQSRKMLDARTVERRVKQYCWKRLGGKFRAGVRYAPHCFRHYFATAFVQNNSGDIVSLQMLMNHKSLEITRRYTKSLGIEILKLKAFSPCDTMRIKTKNKKLTRNKQR